MYPSGEAVIPSGHTMELYHEIEFTDGTTLRITVQEILQDESGLGAYSCRLDDGERSLSCQLTVYRPPVSGAKSGD